MKKNIKKGMSKGTAAVIGGGVAALAAASAGAYYLLGPDAKAHQKKASALLAKMKKEVVAEVKKAKKLSTPVYNKAIDVVSATYAKKYKIYEKDIQAIAKRLKGELKNVSQNAKKVSKVSKISKTSKKSAAKPKKQRA